MYTPNCCTDNHMQITRYYNSRSTYYLMISIITISWYIKNTTWLGVLMWGHRYAIRRYEYKHPRLKLIKYCPLDVTSTHIASDCPLDVTSTPIASDCPLDGNGIHMQPAITVHATVKKPNQKQYENSSPDNRHPTTFPPASFLCNVKFIVRTFFCSRCQFVYLFIYYVIFTQEYDTSAQHCSHWGSCYALFK